MKKISVVFMTVCCLLESFCFFWTGWWASSAFRAAGASSEQAFSIAQGEWEIGFAVLVAGISYGLVPQMRKSLAAGGTIAGIYAVYLFFQSTNVIYHWNILHGDVMAYGNWSNATLLALGVTCSAELFSED